MAARCAKVWNVALHKLLQRYQLDDAVTTPEGALLGWLEVKCRDVKADAYPDLLVALSKVVAARVLRQHSPWPAVLVVRYSDGVFWYELTHPASVRWGGRQDRGDAEDEEPMAVFTTAQRHAMTSNPFREVTAADIRW